AAVLRAVVSDVAREGPCVEIADGDDGVSAQVRGQVLLRTPVRDEGARVADHEARYVGGLAALRVLTVDARVADMGRGHRHDLTGVGGIRQDLLVAGHACREHDFAGALPVGSETPTLEHGSVGEGEKSLSHVVAPTSSKTMAPWASVMSIFEPSSLLRKGELRLFVCRRRSAGIQRACGSTRVSSARAPSRMRGGSIPITRAGAWLIASTRRASVSPSRPTSCTSSPKQSSSPI